jgi:hypothetical protein
MALGYLRFLPFWMKQRQIRVEPVDECTVRLSGPQLPTYELELRPAGNDRTWSTVLYQLTGEGGSRTQIAEDTSTHPDSATAWEAAFELFRRSVIA